MGANSSSDVIEPDVGDDSFGPDVAARLADLAGLADPADLAEDVETLYPLVGTFSDTAVAVCFPGADVEQLRDVREIIGDRLSWALVVLVPEAAPWIVASRDCGAHFIAVALENLAVLAPELQKRQCIAGAVQLLAVAKGMSAGALESALVLADNLMTQGARTAHPVTVAQARHNSTYVGTAPNLSFGAAMAATMVRDHGVRVAVAYCAAGHDTAVAISAAPGVSEAEIREIARGVTGRELPGNGLARFPPPV